MATTANIPEPPPPTSTPTEWSEVERPLLLQLSGMGWTVMAGDTDVPDLTEREKFTQTILRDRLAAAIRRINADDGPLDDLTVERAVRALLDVPAWFDDRLVYQLHPHMDFSVRQAALRDVLSVH